MLDDEDAATQFLADVMYEVVYLHSLAHLQAGGGLIE
jgi:hypothetical protein